MPNHHGSATLMVRVLLVLGCGVACGNEETCSVVTLNTCSLRFFRAKTQEVCKPFLVQPSVGGGGSEARVVFGVGDKPRCEVLSESTLE